MNKLNILLDVDGVVADFFSEALRRVTNATGILKTHKSYRSAQHGFDMAKAFGISDIEFWSIIDKNNFWLNLEPLPWGLDLYRWLREKYGSVTVCASPSLHPEGAGQKATWIKHHLGVGTNEMMIGSRKWLMAKPNAVLIDDYAPNVNAFVDNGGNGILVPSNWNTDSKEITIQSLSESIEIQLRHLA